MQELDQLKAEAGALLTQLKSNKESLQKKMKEQQSLQQVYDLTIDMHIWMLNNIVKHASPYYLFR